MIGKAGLGTPHMDGNTRLCTATAAAALKESFGADGQPGSLHRHRALRRDLPATATTWPRPRPCCGPGSWTAPAATDPPGIVCVDPRRTPVAEEAERTGGVHLAPRVGTNLALMNGADPRAVRQRLGRRGLGRARTPSASTSCARSSSRTRRSRSPTICGVDADDMRRAARIFGESDGVLSTVLQGFYQSHQATAASVRGEQPAPAARA